MQDVGPRCEEMHAAFEVGLSPDQGQGVYNGWSDVDGSNQLRLCHTCIIDVMACNMRYETADANYDIAPAASRELKPPI